MTSTAWQMQSLLAPETFAKLDPSRACKKEISNQNCKNLRVFLRLHKLDTDIPLGKFWAPLPAHKWRTNVILGCPLKLMSFFLSCRAPCGTRIRTCSTGGGSPWCAAGGRRGRPGQGRRPCRSRRTSPRSATADRRSCPAAPKPLAAKFTCHWSSPHLLSRHPALLDWRNC